MTSPFDRLINGIKYDGRLHYIEFIIEGRGDQNRLITNDDGGVFVVFGGALHNYVHISLQNQPMPIERGWNKAINYRSFSLQICPGSRE